MMAPRKRKPAVNEAAHVRFVFGISSDAAVIDSGISARRISDPLQ